MKMKNGLLAFLLAMMVILVLSGCGEKEIKYTVTFLDETTVLKTVDVKEGELAEAYIPAKAGKEFVGWFSTPSKNHSFDFSKEIVENVSVFAGFTTFEEDVRRFAIVGSGTSNLLFTSNWGNTIAEEHYMEKMDGANVYYLTCDILEGDKFQFINGITPGKWYNKRGYGYLINTTLADGTPVFGGSGGIGETSSKGKDLTCLLSGNYTFTLTTYPSDDFYDTTDPTYTEADRQVYNYGTYDKIEWVRNGDPIEIPKVTLDYYIKGSGITSWKDMYNSATKMINTDDSVYTLEVFLRADEEFMFTSTNTINGTASTGAEYIRANTLDLAAQELIGATASYNMKTKQEGMYTFTYTVSTGVMNVTVDTSRAPIASDYYIDGTFGTANWDCPFKEEYKMVDLGGGVYSITGVKLDKDSQIIIQAFKNGATERGTWGTDSYTGLGSFNYSYLAGDGNSFEPVSATNLNIKVNKEGTYNIFFDEYAKIITITDGYDIYIKGGMNGWDHKFSSQWMLSQNTNNEDLYEIVLNFDEGWELGLAKYGKGETSGYGDWIGKDNFDLTGTATSSFDINGNNIKCIKAGAFKVIYDIDANKIKIDNQ